MATTARRSSGGLRARHVPQRTCVGCRIASTKRQFVRTVRAPDGAVRVDPTGKANGRGAYLCPQRSCWDAALKRGRLASALRAEIRPGDLEALRAYAASLPESVEAAEGVQVGEMER